MTWKKIKNLIPPDPPLGEGGESDDNPDGIPSDIIEFVEKYRIIKGKPFSFKDRDYLISIYRDMAKEIYIAKARQVEVTEFAINFLLFYLLKNPGTVGLYVSDRQDHVSAFSRIRLRKEAIGKSKMLKPLISKEGNESCLQFTNGSILWMVSGWDDFEKVRSYSVDFAVIDEVQSLNADAIPILKETLGKSDYGRLVVIGTGSDYGDDWWKLWHTGDQKEWDLQTKRWVVKNLENMGISSYHISQYMVPWISAKEIEIKKLGSNPRYFANEVEGTWYKGTRKPLVESEIRFLFDKTLSLQEPDEVDYTKGQLFLGVDWGGGTKSFTIAWIWQILDGTIPRFQLVYVSKISERSTEKQADMIAELVNRYNIDKGVMDAGGGTRQVQKLEEMYATKIVKVFYTIRPDDPIELVESENKIIVDRTFAIETIIDLITRPESLGEGKGVPRILIPARDPEKVDWIIDHFTCIEAESVNLSGGRKYVRYSHPVESPDDALHACIYAYLAWDSLKREEPWFWISA